MVKGPWEENEQTTVSPQQRNMSIGLRGILTSGKKKGTSLKQTPLKSVDYDYTR